MAIKLEDIEIFSNSLGNNFGGGGFFGGASSGGGTNLTGIPNADYLQNLANLLQQQQQGPQLGPDDFGSYTIPVSDPTYRSGFDYARSIAGGIPMSQVIAPGVSYSPEQPGGYTQEQLNIPRDVERLTPPPILPPTREPDDPRYFGTGIGGVNIPVDRKRIPFREISGPTRDIRDFTQGMNFTNLFGMPSIKPPSQDLDTPYRLRPPIGGGRPTPIPLRPIGVSENNLDVTTVKPPSEESDTPYRLRPPIGGARPIPVPPRSIEELTNSVVTGGRDFSIDREVLERPMISGLENRDLMDVDSLITQVPTGRDFSVDRERIPPQDFGYGPGVLPPLPPMDIRDIPPMDIIDIPPKINDQIFIDDRPIIDERIVDRGYGPGIMPPLPPMDIDKVIPPVDIPFIPFIKPPSIMDRPLIMDTPTIMNRPTGGRFSIARSKPMGLF